MAIQHTVVFTLKHAPGSAEEQEFLVSSRDQLGVLPGVEGFRVNAQVSAKSPLAWQFSMTFADQAAYDGYDAHPVHRAYVASRWTDEVAEFQEYDFTAWNPSA